MTSLGIGRELASSNINRKIPAYPQDETVAVTPRVNATIVFNIMPSLVPENEPPSITVSSRVSNNTIAIKMATMTISSSCGVFPFNLVFRRNFNRDRFV